MGYGVRVHTTMHVACGRKYATSDPSLGARAVQQLQLYSVGAIGIPNEVCPHVLLYIRGTKRG